MAPKQEIVIVGAGIIGVCTAYYLTQHPDFDKDKHHITILEARRPAGGASGKAGGLLALWAFPQQIVPLSFKLHQELADKYGGETEWGYRRLDTLSLEATIYGKRRQQPGVTASPHELVDKSTRYSNTRSQAEPLPENLDWIRPEIVDGWTSIGTTETTAQVHPYRFTSYILKKTLETGAADLVIGKVVKLIRSSAGAVTGVVYETSASSSEETEASTAELKTVELNAKKVVLCMGPWTSKILPTCPISGLRAHSITIKPSRDVSGFAMFTELRVKRGQYVSPEIYPRRDEVYVCGEGDTTIPTPESTDDVEVEREKCNELFKYAGEVSAELQGGRILRRQACYLPVIDVASCSGPFVGATNVENLLLASGHSCWGINNAPATGKLMSEIILEGEAHSASLTGLEPEFYFDAN